MEMRKDLEFIFKKIRAIKTKLRWVSLSFFNHILYLTVYCYRNIKNIIKNPVQVQYPCETLFLLYSSTQYPEAYKITVAASAANRKPVDEEDDDFKPPESRIESKMVATVSTETLKPTTSEDKKKKKVVKPQDESNNNNSPKDDIPNEGNKKEVGNKAKRNSSSSETESASSGDDSDTDTGWNKDVLRLEFR